MKKLEELGISQAPWFCLTKKPDDRLIAAAPNMYKTEYDLVDVVERLMNGWAGTCDTPSQDEVVAALDAAKSALAKAAGEEWAKCK